WVIHDNRIGSVVQVVTPVRVLFQAQTVLAAVKLPVAIVFIVGIRNLVEGKPQILVGVAQRYIHAVVAAQEGFAEIGNRKPLNGGVAVTVQSLVQQSVAGT